MDGKRYLAVAVTVCASIGTVLSCFATETIVRMRQRDETREIGSHHGAPPTTIRAFSLENAAHGAVYTSAFAAQNTFTVYTAAEVSALLQPLKDNLSTHQERLAILEANIKTLSDANDALTKRLSDAETQLKQLTPQ